MATNHSKDKEQQKPGKNTKSNQTDQSEKTVDKHAQKADHKKFMGSTVENPASQSEAGPDIYDIGMGGPGASSSGLRDRDDKEQSED
jgi:hypothetical protein